MTLPPWLAKLAALPVILALLSPVAIADLLFPARAYRYRLTVSVDTPEGVKTGSGVVEVFESRQPGFGYRPAGLVGVAGEAVAVDLGARGALFVLLKDGSRTAAFSSQAASLVPALFPDSGGDTPMARFERYRTQSLKARLSPEQLPLMARFRDPHDPKTVELVADGDLVASFGPGVTLKEATLETTRDPVTRDLDQHLPWLSLSDERLRPLLRGPHWDFRDPAYRLSRRLGLSDFSAGV